MVTGSLQTTAASPMAASRPSVADLIHRFRTAKPTSREERMGVAFSNSSGASSLGTQQLPPLWQTGSTAAQLPRPAASAPPFTALSAHHDDLGLRFDTTAELRAGPSGFVRPDPAVALLAQRQPLTASVESLSPPYARSLWPAEPHQVPTQPIGMVPHGLWQPPHSREPPPAPGVRDSVASASVSDPLEDWDIPGLKETAGDLAEQLDFAMLRLTKR